MKLRSVIFVFFVLIFVNASVKCEEIIQRKVAQVAHNFMEEGRTFVHHAVKRLTFILPAIFFKLGIAFTLLILVTIVAINNGFIGFMLLVVGLSSVLAKLQEARHPHPSPHYVLPPPTAYGHFLDRSDGPPPPSSSSSTSYPYHYTDVVYSKYN